MLMQGDWISSKLFLHMELEIFQICATEDPNLNLSPTNLNLGSWTPPLYNPSSHYYYTYHNYTNSCPELAKHLPQL